MEKSSGKLYFFKKMPRGTKKKVVVIYGANGQILKHQYHNNCRGGNAVEKGKLLRKKYDPTVRRHISEKEMKMKDERHSS